ncbi:MAG: hypothetical protein KC421_06475 [Anaerolineales bacterium]|nr:hypothetical protein [Anaerolineales bacterium]
MAKPKLTSKDQRIIRLAHQGVTFVMEQSQQMAAPPPDAVHAMEQMVAYANDVHKGNLNGIANVAAMAIRAAWQYGRTQKLPGNAVGKATVPAVAGTILHIPRKDQKRINQTSASLLAVLLKQAKEGEDQQRTHSIRLHLWVMYGYGRLSAAKLKGAKQTHATA